MPAKLTPSRRRVLSWTLGASGIALMPGASLARPPRPSSGRLVDLLGLAGDTCFVLARTDGEIISSRWSNRAVAPASTLKIMTALYALERLGPEHRFTTTVWRDGDRLTLAGGGNPVLDSADLADLAGETAALSGHPDIKDFDVWGGALPYMAEIAPVQADHLAYNPSLSGMIVNFNRVILNWRCGAHCDLQVSAPVKGHTATAWSIETHGVAGRGVPRARFVPWGEAWDVPVDGMEGEGRRSLPVRIPELFAGDLFQTFARAKGLPLPKPEIRIEVPRGEIIAQHDSPPLRDIISGMLEYSTNLTAEALGLAASGAPDLLGSAKAMELWASAQGISGIHAVDHSGLSYQNEVTASALMAILSGPGRRLGIRALLARHPKTPGGRPTCEVRAKTGTLNFVSNLAGIMEDGRIFVILTTDRDRANGAIGKDMPAGVSTWTQQSKRLQGRLLDLWCADQSLR